MSRRGEGGIAAFVAAVLGLMAPAVAPAAVPASFVQAHRGGAYVNGVPTYAENTLPGFQHAASLGFVDELDAKLTADGVPVVIHDDSLDRTTACTGKVADHTLAQLADCPADVLGVPGSGLPTAPATTPVPIPTLAAVLAWAKGAGATLSIEIKNLPTDGDFDPTPGFANTVMGTIKASGFPLDHLIVQSFWPVNLLAAKLALPGVQTSFLSLAQLNPTAAVAAAVDRDAWSSPAWPIAATQVSLAHKLGRKVVPYTIDTAAGVRGAKATGVDAVITNDPEMALAALDGP